MISLFFIVDVFGGIGTVSYDEDQQMLDFNQVCK